MADERELLIPDKKINLRAGKYFKPFQEGYLHAKPLPITNLYKKVRRELNITQVAAGNLVGIERTAWRYRENTKTLFHLGEVAALHVLSGVSPDEFMRWIYECAGLHYEK